MSTPPKVRCVPVPEGSKFSIMTATEIRIGDLVVFVEQGGGKFIQKAVTPDEATQFEGLKYRVTKGDEPGMIVYVPDQSHLPTVVHRIVVPSRSTPTPIPYPTPKAKPWWRFW